MFFVKTEFGVWRMAYKPSFPGCFCLKSRPLLEKRARTTHFIVSCRLCLCKPFGRHRGCAAYPTTLQIFHPMRFLAFTNTADRQPSCKAGWKMQFCPASQRNSRSLKDALGGTRTVIKTRNDQRQRKQIRPTRSAGGSNCFLPSYFTPFGYPVRSGTLAFYPAGCR